MPVQLWQGVVVLRAFGAHLLCQDGRPRLRRGHVFPWEKQMLVQLPLVAGELEMGAPDVRMRRDFVVLQFP